MHRRSRTLWAASLKRVLVVVAALVAAACGGTEAERTGGPLLAWTRGQSTIDGVIAPGSAMAFGIPPFAVQRPLTIDAVELIDASEGLRLRAARVSFLACTKCRRRPGFVGVRGLATTVCVGSFPPPSFGPTYDAGGLELHPSDAPSLLLYLDATAPGHYEVAGYRVRYHDATGERYVIELTNVRIAVDQRGTGSDACTEPDDTVWTGGTGGKQQVVPLD